MHNVFVHASKHVPLTNSIYYTSVYWHLLMQHRYDYETGTEKHSSMYFHFCALPAWGMWRKRVIIFSTVCGAAMWIITVAPVGPCNGNASLTHVWSVPHLCRTSAAGARQNIVTPSQKRASQWHSAFEMQNMKRHLQRFCLWPVMSEGS